MNRRGFMQSILAAGVAPAFVGSSILMPMRQLWTPARTIIPAQSYIILVTMYGSPGVQMWVEDDIGRRWWNLTTQVRHQAIIEDMRLNGGIITAEWKLAVA